ncbi:carboxypeptidase regulatory-like domain-containing protein [Mucilaginibacter antarcticus]|uniref:carboxypeptidase regulatory-like domain-containing protein n=1 Tax=Mucilaginibacter antarcticus TaxID=1855725 RepID=UPI00363F65C9
MKKTLLFNFKVMVCFCFAFLYASVNTVQAVTVARLSTALYQQETGTITGKVVDEKGETLPGATITVKGINQVVIAGADGTFKLNVAAGTYDITVAYISYTTVTLSKITVKAGENTPVNVILKGETGSLNEVLIVGYGTQKRANATGAVDQISAKSLENRPITNLTQGLQGQIANLNLRMGDGKPTQSPAYNIRGATSIGQGAML